MSKRRRVISERVLFPKQGVQIFSSVQPATHHSLLIIHLSWVIKPPFSARLHQDRDFAHFTLVIILANGGNDVAVRKMIGRKGFFELETSGLGDQPGEIAGYIAKCFAV